MVSKLSKKSLFGTMAILGVFTLIAFQNCSPTKFNNDEASISLKSGGLEDDIGVDPNPDAPGDGEDPLVPSEEAGKLVECQMLHPNEKITLSKELALASNKSSTRICMSENACLKIINEFAAKHSCSFDKDAPASAEGTQCTEIFPGSKGTCHNATVLSDVKVKELLQ